MDFIGASLVQISQLIEKLKLNSWGKAQMEIWTVNEEENMIMQH